jgi:Domain of unknown function (DUF1841)
MFTPNQQDVRRFFCRISEKLRTLEPMEPLEHVAAPWVSEHPEYYLELSDLERALRLDYPVDGGRENPFLHLSMHLSIEEQCSIDQPRGIQAAVNHLSERLGSRHQAHHAVMECLGTMIWESQRSGQAPDPHRYLECVKMKATS